LESFLLNTAVHHRNNFSCEIESLTNYLKKQVSQDIKRSLAACFVFIDAENEIKGYYTLSNSSLDRNEVPEEHKKRVPQNYAVPVTLLGRLARDISMRGTGMGEKLLMDALYRSYKIATNSIASMAVIVDPINEKAVQFYGNYGFIQLPDSGKMFLPMKTIEKLFQSM
jgi:predicted GNAT family N-acyltransferase